MTIHTVWVPAGLSFEQVWETIERGELVPQADGADGKDEGEWVNYDDGKGEADDR